MARITTPNEEKLLTDIDAAEKAGGDPFGDDEEIIAPTTATMAAEDQARMGEVTDDADEETKEKTKKEVEEAEEEEEEKPEAEEPADKEEPEVEEEKDSATDVLPDIDPRTFRTQPIDKLVDDRKALMVEKSANMKKLMDGEIDADAHAALDNAVQDKLDQNLIDRTLAQANVQRVENEWDNSIKAIMRTAKADGVIDYAKDAKAQKQFDAAWKSIRASDPEAATMPPSELHKEAHAMVLAMRGIAAAQKTEPTGKDAVKPVKLGPDGKPDKTPPARVQAKPPVTLRGLPSAAISNTGGDGLDAMRRLSGPAFQTAFAKLTPAQRAALTDTED